jgi:hypothetical protein
MIPNIFHFIYGFNKNDSIKPFPLAYYLAIRSAAEINKPEEILFHYQYEPVGEYWEAVKPYLTLNMLTAPDQFMGRSLFHFAHQADVIRLQTLYNTGGIYLDLDTICVKPFTGLLENRFVIGKELHLPYRPKNYRQKLKLAVRKKLGLAEQLINPAPKLCNAVLLAEKNSEFVKIWMDQYRSFRSRGHDKYWNEHSGKVPMKLALKFPELVTLMNPYAFHYPLYNKKGMQELFEEVHHYPEAFVHHLWESFSWEPYLSKLTVPDIRQRDTTYHLYSRKIL